MGHGSYGEHGIPRWLELPEEKCIAVLFPLKAGRFVSLQHVAHKGAVFRRRHVITPDHK